MRKGLSNQHDKVTGRPFAVMINSAVIAVVVSSCLQIAAAQNDNGRAAVKAVVDNIVLPAMQQSGAPGAVVGVSIHGKRYFFAYGQAREDGTQFTPTTEVEIGSCTKVFTTTLFGLAIGRKQMAADGPAQSYMPTGFRLQATAQGLTPRELANFTSGMPDTVPGLPAQLPRRDIENFTTSDFLQWASTWAPDGPLPAPYLYSNAGTGLLGYLIETAVGKPWQSQLSAEITEPLGMSDTTMHLSPDQMGRLAQGHRSNGRAAPSWPVFAWYAAGALRSTALDMLRFGEANLGHAQVDGRPVSAELTAAMRLAQTPTYDLPSGNGRQGMAWVTRLGDQPGLAPEVVKNGGTVGFSTVILLHFRKDAAVFIAINKQKAVRRSWRSESVAICREAISLSAGSA